MDKILSLSFVRRDEDGKIYFEVPVLTETMKRHAAEIAMLLMFIATTRHKVHFPIKEELLGLITDYNSRPFSDIGNYHSLASSETKCMENMRIMVNAGEMESGERMEFYREMIEAHRNKYIENARSFL